MIALQAFSPLMKNDVYRRLASLMGVSYVSLHSRHVLPPALHQYSGVQIIHNKTEFLTSCVGHNASSYDGMLLAYCNRASKGHPIVVPVRALARALEDAVDEISAFSGSNPEWVEERERLAAAAAAADGTEGARPAGIGAGTSTSSTDGSKKPYRSHGYIGPDADVDVASEPHPGLQAALAAAGREAQAFRASRVNGQVKGKNKETKKRSQSVRGNSDGFDVVNGGKEDHATLLRDALVDMGRQQGDGALLSQAELASSSMEDLFSTLMERWRPGDDAAPEW